MTIPEDIRMRVQHDFQQQAEKAISLIQNALGQDPHHFLPPRQLRCAVFVAQGDTGTLQQALQLGLTDCRDLIMWGEYVVQDGKLVRKHNWNDPFGEEVNS
ncbi:hypothetical protein [Deinococcus roseus]|uniref:Uncharacterized protein n=1 Tax=Deinococcus roseus TaxID=392414 RepID=A0ABQ2D1K9_9DEIO|nr:hypothetical protein [Deinococcus roseus]GGJ34566.1 hypothetical protein GCM10008938_20950 [Deinococcus roseus]